MIVAKMHRKDDQAIFAACDSELLGTVLESGSGPRTKISRSFFGDEEVGHDDFLIMLGQSTSANLFGKETVACVRDAGYIDDDSIIQVGGVPHAQLFFF